MNVETYGNRRADIYRCSSRDRGARCGGSRIIAALAEAWVWESVCTILREPDRIANELQRRQSTGPDTTLTSDLETARRRIVTLEQKQTNLMERYTASTDDSFPLELVMRQIKNMEPEKAQWQKQADEIEKRLEEETVSLQQLVSLQEYCERV